jgi:hypothetical protein
MNMATPLNKLPPSTDELTHGAGAQNADADADDVVNAVLQDMESELSAQEASGATEPPRRPAPTHAQPTAVPRPLAAPQTSNVTGFLGAFDINMDNLKMAAWIIVLSAIAFQPNLTRALYERIPRLSMLESYDIFVRAILLGVFFYVLLTYAKIM